MFFANLGCTNYIGDDDCMKCSVKGIIYGCKHGCDAYDNGFDDSKEVKDDRKKEMPGVHPLS